MRRSFTMAPYLVWMALFIIVPPMFLVVYYAFTVPTQAGTGLSLANFGRFF